MLFSAVFDVVGKVHFSYDYQKKFSDKGAER